MEAGLDLNLVDLEQMLADQRFLDDEEAKVIGGGDDNLGTVKHSNEDVEVVGISLDKAVREGDNLGLLEHSNEDNCTPNKVRHLEGSPLPPPAVGMVFPTMEDLDDYYRRYGVQQGFGVVRSASGRYNSKEVVEKRVPQNAKWTCDRFGRPNRKRKAKRKRFVTDAQLDEPEMARASKKCGCSVHIYASVNGNNEWEVKKVVNEHENHEPTPSKSSHLVAVRKEQMTDQVKRRLKLGDAVGLKISQIYNMLAQERNGLDELALTERDLRNERDKDKRLQLKDGDANAMLDYFDKMTAGNQNFFHTFRLDDASQLQDILWVDARSRVAYEEFGDVVVFDTTYLTNKYEMPFANFVGVNHYGQTILLGCALVLHETTETFAWVFHQWIHCMNGKAPAGILTDQSVAMRCAIQMTMPETRHRWCIWHITSKFTDKFSWRKDNDKLREDWLSAIYDT